ncbi:MAG: helix-turn-helix domain-containing protein, partial [Dysgonamonadaceae bacterium]|nr:helix-turn-helix domain-containing protein [Dysgonamonadaceae bacterium]
NLPPTLQTGFSSDTIDKGTLSNVLEKVERQMIMDTLILTKGNMAKAAAQLGITERMIGLRINKYNLTLQNYKQLSNEKS